MNTFDGKFHAQLLTDKTKDFLSSNVCDYPLTIIQIGDNSTSESYIRLKIKLCDQLGIKTFYKKVQFVEHTSTFNEIAQEIQEIINQNEEGGVIIQLPLPDKSLTPILDLIPENRDVDLLSSVSQTKFFNVNSLIELKESMLPPVIRATEYFLNEAGFELQYNSAQPKALLIGYGFLVGKPLEKFLNLRGFMVDVTEEYLTGSPIKGYDLVISSVGRPELVRLSDIDSNTNIIDFGSTVVEGLTKGDIVLDSSEHNGLVSTSPGGLGPLVVRFLVMNHLGL